jgi:hypothetical protein
VNTNIIARLDQLKESLEDAVSEVESETPAQAAFGIYIGEISARLEKSFDVSRDEALEFVLEVAESEAEDQDMPDIPDTSDDDEVFAEWLKAAAREGFAEVVVSVANQIAE